MSLIVNPGSGAVRASGNGWTNTQAVAEAKAAEWLGRIHAEGMTEVQLSGPEPVDGEGRWRFGFTHSVTGVTVVLETHGIDDTAAYERERVFLARVYWNGSSISEPELQDWAAPGFVPVRTYRPDADNSIRCPACGSRDVECVERPHHNHICHACGHSLLPAEFAGKGTADAAPCVPPRATDVATAAPTGAPLPGVHAPHGVAEACLRHPGGGFVRCYCKAWFSSPVLDEATEAYRNHMVEGVLPQGEQT